jgi:hypothetical protein
MARRVTPGIFCVEGPWSSRLTDKASVGPLLEFLEHSGKVRFTHHRANSLGEVENVVRRWRQKQYARYSLGYFGFHGDPGRLHVGRRKISLEELGEHLDGACRGKTIYFGSCAVLDVPKGRIEAFRRITRARCVVGYTKDVDWYASCAFDLLLFEALTYYRRIDFADRWLAKEYGPLRRKLGFRMHYGA